MSAYAGGSGSAEPEGGSAPSRVEAGPSQFLATAAVTSGTAFNMQQGTPPSGQMELDADPPSKPMDASPRAGANAAADAGAAKPKRRPRPPQPPRPLLLACPPMRAAALRAAAALSSQCSAGSSRGGVSSTSSDADDESGGSCGGGGGSVASSKRAAARGPLQHAARMPQSRLGREQGEPQKQQRATNRGQAQVRPEAPTTQRPAPANPAQTSAGAGLPTAHCASCGRDKPVQPNNPGFFAHGTGAYTCNGCCRENLTRNGFYGPPGTHSLQEAGGRECAECGAVEASKWSAHKGKLGAYVCPTCASRWKRVSSYQLQPPRCKGASGPAVAGDPAAAGAAPRGGAAGAPGLEAEEEEEEADGTDHRRPAKRRRTSGQAPRSAEALPPPPPLTRAHPSGHAQQELAAPPPPPPPPPMPQSPPQSQTRTQAQTVEPVASAPAAQAPQQPGPTIPCSSCGGACTPKRGRGRNGFFAHGSRAYTCDACCWQNCRDTGFYGPPGTRSLEEAGGRECAECKDRSTADWRRHPTELSLYICRNCEFRIRYCRRAAGANAKPALPAAAPAAAPAGVLSGAERQSAAAQVAAGAAAPGAEPDVLGCLEGAAAAAAREAAAAGVAGATSAEGTERGGAGEAYNGTGEGRGGDGGNGPLDALDTQGTLVAPTRSGQAGAPDGPVAPAEEPVPRVAAAAVADAAAASSVGACVGSIAEAGVAGAFDAAAAELARSEATTAAVLADEAEGRAAEGETASFAAAAAAEVAEAEAVLAEEAEARTSVSDEDVASLGAAAAAAVLDAEMQQNAEPMLHDEATGAEPSPCALRLDPPATASAPASAQPTAGPASTALPCAAELSSCGASPAAGVATSALELPAGLDTAPLGLAPRPSLEAPAQDLHVAPAAAAVRLPALRPPADVQAAATEPLSTAVVLSAETACGDAAAEAVAAPAAVQEQPVHDTSYPVPEPASTLGQGGELEAELHLELELEFEMEAAASPQAEATAPSAVTANAVGPAAAEVDAMHVVPVQQHPFDRTQPLALFAPLTALKPPPPPPTPMAPPPLPTPSPAPPPPPPVAGAWGLPTTAPPPPPAANADEGAACARRPDAPAALQPPALQHATAPAQAAGSAAAETPSHSPTPVPMMAPPVDAPAAAGVRDATPCPPLGETRLSCEAAAGRTSEQQSLQLLNDAAAAPMESAAARRLAPEPRLQGVVPPFAPVPAALHQAPGRAGQSTLRRSPPPLALPPAKRQRLESPSLRLTPSQALDGGSGEMAAVAGASPRDEAGLEVAALRPQEPRPPQQQQQPAPRLHQPPPPPGGPPGSGQQTQQPYAGAEPQQVPSLPGALHMPPAQQQTSRVPDAGNASLQQAPYSGAVPPAPTSHHLGSTALVAGTPVAVAATTAPEAAAASGRPNSAAAALAAGVGPVTALALQPVALPSPRPAQPAQLSHLRPVVPSTIPSRPSQAFSFPEPSQPAAPIDPRVYRPPSQPVPQAPRLAWTASRLRPQRLAAPCVTPAAPHAAGSRAPAAAGAAEPTPAAAEPTAAAAAPARVAPPDAEAGQGAARGAVGQQAGVSSGVDAGGVQGGGAVRVAGGVVGASGGGAVQAEERLRPGAGAAGVGSALPAHLGDIKGWVSQLRRKVVAATKALAAMDEAGGAAPTQSQADRARRYGDTITRWLQVHALPRRLSLMLGPSVAALGLHVDTEGPSTWLDAEQQADWDRERANTCKAFATAADVLATQAEEAAACPHGSAPAGPSDAATAASFNGLPPGAATHPNAHTVTPVTLDRLQHVVSYLAQKLEARLAPRGDEDAEAATEEPPVPAPPVQWPEKSPPPPPPSPRQALLGGVVLEGLRLSFRLGSVSGGDRGGYLVTRVPPPVPSLGQGRQQGHAGSAAQGIVRKWYAIPAVIARRLAAGGGAVQEVMVVPPTRWDEM